MKTISWDRMKEELPAEIYDEWILDSTEDIAEFKENLGITKPVLIDLTKSGKVKVKVKRGDY